MKFFSLLLLSALLISCAQTPNSYNYKTRDQGLIDHMIKQGTNPQKLHYVSFFLECQSKEDLNNILRVAEEKGFELEYVAFSNKKNLWTSAVNASMPLNTESLAKHRNRLLPHMPKTGCLPLLFGATIEK